MKIGDKVEITQWPWTGAVAALISVSDNGQLAIVRPDGRDFIIEISKDHLLLIESDKPESIHF